jgi:hypothetical protein
MIMRDKTETDMTTRDVYDSAVGGLEASRGGDVINQGQKEDLKKIIDELRVKAPELADEKKQKLESEIRTIESETESPNPKKQKIKDALFSAKGIIEGASNVVAAAAAAPLITRVVSWLSGVP